LPLRTTSNPVIIGWALLPEARPDHEGFMTAADHAVDAAIPRLDELRRRYSAVTAEVVVRALIQHEFCGQLAGVSSFGAESAVLLALIAEIDRGVPILFFDTDKLFCETLPIACGWIENYAH
jgi:3'-phosphoadenosine 5'-phosphosulfate sulfotransferase (PAPS reductase)/FAD synthetase